MTNHGSSDQIYNDMALRLENQHFKIIPSLNGANDTKAWEKFISETKKNKNL